MRYLAPLPPQEYLRSIFDYDPEEGILRWRYRPDRPANWNGKLAGKAILHVGSNAYINVGIDGTAYLVHRVIFKWMTGQDPDRLMDHRDTDKQNNSWENLRPATDAQNKINRPTHRNGRLKGAHKQVKGATWASSIKANGKRVYLGNFSTEEEAHAAYCAAAPKYHGVFANTGGCA